MLTKTLISATLATSMALIPASQAAADGKDFLAGALIGGVVGHAITKEKRRERQREYRPAPRANYVAPTQRHVAPTSRVQRAHRPSIPATQEGRRIQASLNYFGFNAGTVDGQIGGKTRAAVASYQTYLGYDATGSLTPFQQDLLVSSYNRAQAGGDQTYRRAAQLPDGTRGLLKSYRADIASGQEQTSIYAGG